MLTIAPQTRGFSVSARGRFGVNRSWLMASVAGVAVVALTGAVTAADVSWVGGLLGHEDGWEFDQNWDLGGVPTASDDVTIGGGPGVVVIDAQSAASVQLDGSLSVRRGGTLTVGLGITTSSGGSFYSDGEVYADITNNGGLSNTNLFYGNLSNNAANVSNSVDVDNGRTEAIWTGDVLSNAGQIINHDGATWVGAVLGNTYDWTTQFGVIQNFGTWSDGTISNNAGMILNYDGTWSGDILSNSDFIDNNIDDGTTNVGGFNLAEWAGNIYGNTGVIKNDQRGKWTGTVIGNTGQIDNLGKWFGTISGNGVSGGPVGTSSSYIQNEATGTWTGDIAGNYGLIKNMGGIWNGNVLGNGLGGGAGGTVSNDTLGIWNGEVRGNAGRIDNNNVWTGAVTGNAGAINNRGQWIGPVLASGTSGTITNFTSGTWTGDVLGNTGTIVNTGKWIGSFTNAGTVTARNTITGAFSNSGLLRLTGALAGITTLTNTGTLDMRGTNAGQTLTATSVIFGAGSTYDVSIDSAGHADRVIATAATLGGAVLVTAKRTGGSYGFNTSYTILHAASISGAFAGVASDLAFLAPRLSYSATDVDLTMLRNDVGFATTGVTANQRAVGTTVEGYGAGNAIYDAVLWLTQPEAQQAFDALSGEAAASNSGILLQNSGLARDLALDRLRQLFGQPSQVDASSSYAEADAPARSTSDSGFWTNFYGAIGTAAASPDNAATASSAGGVAIGLDTLAADWHVGVTLHAGLSSTAASAVATMIGSEDFGAGIYAGRTWGNTRLALGADYTRHALHATRTVAFPGLAENLASSYGAGTAQAFAELSHELEFGAVSVLPYAGIAHVQQATDRFAETGGAAALSGAATLIDATFTSLGVRGESKAMVGDAMLLTASAALGWRHAFADPTRGTHAFAGSTAFAITGAPLASDVLILSAGLNLDVSETAKLDLTYDGQFGNATQAHTLKATWATQF